MDPTEYTVKLQAFHDALIKFSRNVKSITIDHWGIIGSTALFVRGLTDYIPKDIDVIVSERDLRSICKYYQVEYPEMSYGDEKRLSSNRISIQLDGVMFVIAANLRYLSPTGVYETIIIDELRTEYIQVSGQYVWNVITTGTYMSLAGRFNRGKDRSRLKTLYDKQVPFERLYAD